MDHPCHEFQSGSFDVAENDALFCCQESLLLSTLPAKARSEYLYISAHFLPENIGVFHKQYFEELTFRGWVPMEKLIMIAMMQKV